MSEADKKPPATANKMKGNEEDAPANTTNRHASTTTSVFNVVLGLVLALGMGAIVGYFIFSFIYNHRCSDIMDEAEIKFSQTRNDLNNQLKAAMEKGAASDSFESEILDLRGRLSRHEVLVREHQVAQQELNELQSQHENDSIMMSEFKSKILALEAKLHDNESTSEKMEDCELRQVTSLEHVRNLHRSLCQEKYGPLPYYIQFDVDLGEENDEVSFVLEISDLESLSNSVFSFMTLVEHGVYEEAEFLSTHSIMHLDSDEEKVAALDYAKSALALVEHAAEGPCMPYSVGFVGGNGGLKVIMTNDASKHGSLSCFGRIAQGRQSMSRIQHAAKSGNGASIRSVKKVTLSSKPMVGEGEL